MKGNKEVNKVMNKNMNVNYRNENEQQNTTHRLITTKKEIKKKELPKDIETIPEKKEKCRCDKCEII